MVSRKPDPLWQLFSFHYLNKSTTLTIFLYLFSFSLYITSLPNLIVHLFMSCYYNFLWRHVWILEGCLRAPRCWQGDLEFNSYSHILTKDSLVMLNSRLSQIEFSLYIPSWKLSLASVQGQNVIKFKAFLFATLGTPAFHSLLSFFNVIYTIWPKDLRTHEKKAKNFGNILS